VIAVVMAYPRVGRAFQLPLESSKSLIDQISASSSEDSTVLCIRTTGHRLHLRCFCNTTEPVTVSSLQLSLPKEASNQVVSACIVSVFPKLIINILTQNGTLITLDVSKFLVKGNLPEIAKQGSAATRTFTTIEDGSNFSPNKQLSLYDLSIGSKSSSDRNAFKAEVGVHSNTRFEQQLPSSLSLELTLKLAIVVEDLGYADQDVIHKPLCMLSLSKHHPGTWTGTGTGTEYQSISAHSKNSEDSKDRFYVISFISCSRGTVRSLFRPVSYHHYF
jgi:hypothetical protein